MLAVGDGLVMHHLCCLPLGMVIYGHWNVVGVQNHGCNTMLAM